MGRILARICVCVYRRHRRSRVFMGPRVPAQRGFREAACILSEFLFPLNVGFWEIDMPITIGMGDHRYEYRPDWAKLPRGMEFQAPSAVAVDSHDNLYVFQRGDPPVLVFDPNGELVSQWPRKDGTPADAHLSR